MNNQKKMNTLKWDNIPWTLIEKYIFQIQKRIYCAEKKSDNKHVLKLQKKFSKSWSLQTKIVSESFPNFLTKNTKDINETKLFQNYFPFFYNNKKIRNRFLSILFRFFSLSFGKKKKQKKKKEVLTKQNKRKKNILLNHLIFKNSNLLIISNQKKKEANSKNRKEIFLKKKISFYRKSTSLEKKLIYLLQMFSLTKNFSNLETLSQKLDKEKRQRKKNKKKKSTKNSFSFLGMEKTLKFAQTLKKIEPQWKARSECYSYSLNPGPSDFQKIQAISKNLRNQPKYILNIEIKSFTSFFFEKRNRNEFENFLCLLKDLFFYGFEKAFFHILKKQYYLKMLSCSFSKQILIFDKNQIVIFHNSDIFLKKCYQFLINDSNFFLFFGKKKQREKKSEISVFDSKVPIQTKIFHSFLSYENNPPGFDFLGFHISQLNKKQYFQKNNDLEYFKRPIFNLNFPKLNIQTFITPSLSNVRSHLEQIRTILKQSKTSTQELLITRLSPKIRGWSKFSSLLDGYQKVAHYCDYLTFKMLWRWACRRHPKKNRKWIKCKYFRTLNGKNWLFCVAKKEKLSGNSTKNLSNNQNFLVFPTSSYFCLPFHRDIQNNSKYKEIPKN